MLGVRECKQVSLILYREGRHTGLFTRECPMSADDSFGQCPFFEDEDDLGEK